MLFRLMILLVGVIFLVMYVAKEPTTPRPVRQAAPVAPATETPEQPKAEPAQASLPEPGPPQARVLPPPVTLKPRVTAPEVAAVPEAGGASLGAVDLEALPEDMPGALTDQLPGYDAVEAPVQLPGFGASGLDVGGSLDAMSLADRVKARIESGVQVQLSPPSPTFAPETTVVEDTAVAAPAAAPDAGGIVMAEVTASAVNLRAGPTTDAAVVGRVSEGEQVEYLGETVPGWSQIRLPGSDTPVFMSRRFLRVLDN